MGQMLLHVMATPRARIWLASASPRLGFQTQLSPVAPALEGFYAGALAAGLTKEANLTEQGTVKSVLARCAAVKLKQETADAEFEGSCRASMAVEKPACCSNRR
jgi:hypothetical protein